MSSDVNLKVIYRIANAPVCLFPYPHIFVRDVFPAHFYEELRRSLPPAESYQTLHALGRVSPAYSNKRSAVPLTPEHIDALPEPAKAFWTGVGSWLLGGLFAQTMVHKFAPTLQQRFGVGTDPALFDEAFIVRDSTTYNLGPHTDSAHKVLSALFYLPPDESLAHLGTSVYVPKDHTFTCNGGPHHPFGDFKLVTTMPYVPNSFFAFPRTNSSFHGVKHIQDDAVCRDILQYDIKTAMPVAVAPPAPGKPELKLVAKAAKAPAKFYFA